MKTIYRKRLENLARILREAAAKKLRFNMKEWGFAPEAANKCGTPACALGHYGARTDAQRSFWLDRSGELFHRNKSLKGYQLIGAAAEHFGLSFEEAHAMFGGNAEPGDNRAKTPAGAAQYVERFIARALKAA